MKEELFKKLYFTGVHIVTKIRKNMKNILMDMTDKIMLPKRLMIEFSGSVLTCSYNLEHSRYRSPKTLVLKVYSCNMAYAFHENKPSVRKKWLFLLTRTHVFLPVFEIMNLITVICYNDRGPGLNRDLPISV
ncbi:hypothetical protein H0X06_00430 [Candidatus Dependentiae bacterium]|nr:hypothetical protein [Candidatus Dependentiae bacterium]